MRPLAPSVANGNAIHNDEHNNMECNKLPWAVDGENAQARCLASQPAVARVASSESPYVSHRGSCGWMIADVVVQMARWTTHDEVRLLQERIVCLAMDARGRHVHTKIALTYMPSHFTHYKAYSIISYVPFKHTHT